jgi:hypothetical protein
MRYRSVAWSVGCALALSLAAQAADPIAFDVKPGLWEMSDGGSKVSGQVPDAMVAALPPARRAQAKADMLEAFSKREKSDKSCITAEELKKGFDSDDKNCKILTKSISPAAFTVSQVCSDEQGGKTTVSASFQRLSREQISGKISFTMMMGGQSLSVEQNLSGKWLGASCGNVDKKWSSRE